jgi:hypothetical protein
MLVAQIVVYDFGQPSGGDLTVRRKRVTTLELSQALRGWRDCSGDYACNNVSEVLDDLCRRIRLDVDLEYWVGRPTGLLWGTGGREDGYSYKTKPFGSGRYEVAL